MAFGFPCEPMMYRTKTQEDFDHENNLFNPYSKVTCLILYLYSMDIGIMPLYASVNRAVVEMDSSSVKKLGPYISALGYIVAGAEGKRQKLDKLESGTIIGGKTCCLSGNFILFRGTQIMKN